MEPLRPFALSVVKERRQRRREERKERGSHAQSARHTSLLSLSTPLPLPLPHAMCIPYSSPPFSAASQRSPPCPVSFSVFSRTSPSSVSSRTPAFLCLFSQPAFRCLSCPASSPLCFASSLALSCSQALSIGVGLGFASSHLLHLGSCSRCRFSCRWAASSFTPLMHSASPSGPSVMLRFYPSLDALPPPPLSLPAHCPTFAMRHALAERRRPQLLLWPADGRPRLLSLRLLCRPGRGPEDGAQCGGGAEQRSGRHGRAVRARAAADARRVERARGPPL